MDLSDTLLKIVNLKHRTKVIDFIDWIKEQWPNLELKIKWNQPMFTNKGTFILALSFSKEHMGIALEKLTMDYFRDELLENEYNPSSMLFRIKWDQAINFRLLAKMIHHNIETKANETSFWRK